MIQALISLHAGSTATDNAYTAISSVKQQPHHRDAAGFSRATRLGRRPCSDTSTTSAEATATGTSCADAISAICAAY